MAAGRASGRASGVAVQVSLNFKVKMSFILIVVYQLWFAQPHQLPNELGKAFFEKSEPWPC